MSSWPGTLPDFEIDGLEETPPDLVLRTKMDAGAEKLRRRYTAGVRPITGQMLMTKAQVATHDTFYVTTLVGGTLAFDWTHPRTGESVEMRYTKPPTYKMLGPDTWRVTLDLEILP